MSLKCEQVLASSADSGTSQTASDEEQTDPSGGHENICLAANSKESKRMEEQTNERKKRKKKKRNEPRNFNNCWAKIAGITLSKVEQHQPREAARVIKGPEEELDNGGGGV